MNELALELGGVYFGFWKIVLVKMAGCLISKKK